MLLVNRRQELQDNRLHVAVAENPQPHHRFTTLSFCDVPLIPKRRIKIIGYRANTVIVFDTLDRRLDSFYRRTRDNEPLSQAVKIGFLPLEGLTNTLTCCKNSNWLSTKYFLNSLSMLYVSWIPLPLSLISLFIKQQQQPHIFFPYFECFRLKLRVFRLKLGHKDYETRVSLSIMYRFFKKMGFFLGILNKCWFF